MIIKKQQIKKKLSRLKKNPLEILNRHISSFLESHKYSKKSGYLEEKYWHSRLSKAKFDLRGAGRGDLTHKENLKEYNKAKKTFSALCEKEKINFKKAKILEVGSGSGFYTQFFKEMGVKNYLGMDITNALFDRLKGKFQNFTFIKGDITKDEINGEFDLIIMIDVTQHITDKKKFSFAMKNIKTHLKESGVFIVTSWLSNKFKKNSFYEVLRPLRSYKKEFPENVFSKPLKFRDKFIFSIKNCGVA